MISSIQSDIKEYNLLFDITKIIKEERELLLSQQPYHINIIDELHINENAHSRILAKLLQFKNANGQYEILASLIDYIKRKSSTSERKSSYSEFERITIEAPVITQEKKRIDLWVRDYSRKCALIFENKIYDAIDQESQLYNYIEKTRNDSIYQFKDSEIFVFYLTKFGYEPSEQTWGDDKTKQAFLSRYMGLSFRDDILEWLKQSIIPNIRQKDKYLLSAVSQYVDYLEGLFSIRKINKLSNMNLQKIISDKLGLEGCGDNEALNKIQKTINEFQEVLNQLNSMQNDIIKEQKLKRRNIWEEYQSQVKDQVKSVSEELGLEAEFDLNEQDSGFYISFKKEDWELSIVIEKYDDNSFFIYIGKAREQTVDKHFRDSGIWIFNGKTEAPNHPYGWEYLAQYNKKPENLFMDIQSGEFEKILKKEVGNIIKSIYDNNVKMSMD